MPDGSGFGPCDCGGGMDAGDGADAGGGTDDAGTPADAGGSTDAAVDAGPDPDDCDPVADTGCAAGEKCSWKVESTAPMVGRTTCVPEGTVAVGGECTWAAADAGGYDDCVGGSWCVGGECRPACDATDDTCASGSVCSEYVGSFADRENLGACEETCNLITQDCVDGEACYLDLSSGAALCSPPSSGAESREQGDDCEFVNDCPLGYGCALNDDPVSPTGLVCAYYCDAAGGGGPACTDTEGPGAGFGCESLQDLYTGLPDSIPTAVGICVPCADYPSAPGCS